MRFQTPLIAGTLIRRYNRFLSDIVLESGETVKAHCPNPGSMMGLKDEGLRVWVEPNDDPKKKLKYGWRLVECEDGTFVGVDTSLANRIVREGLDNKLLGALSSYEEVRPEVKYGENSRIDFLLSRRGLPDAYVEVKSVTLSRSAGLAEFPDSVTARGAKHLGALAQMVDEGHRAALVFLLQRGDCERLSVAGDIDPAYAKAYEQALAAGVEVYGFDTQISPKGINFGNPVELAPSAH